MPKYLENVLTAKKITFENFLVLMIRGENPNCNGNNCQSYYLHFIILDADSIKMNFIYLFDNKKEKFEDFEVAFRNSKILLTNKVNIIDSIPF